MSTTLDGTTLPEPAACTMSADEVSVQRRMANGTLRTAIVAVNRRWQMSWNGLTAGDRNALRTDYETTTAQTFKPPDTATTYTVYVVPNSWTEEHRGTTQGIRYWVSMALAEV